MTGQDVILSAQWVFLGYFILINLGYLTQNVVAVFSIRRYLQVAEQYAGEGAFSSLDVPISIVMPAYNESVSIITSVRAMLQLEYPDFELIVVNDGSTDDTLEKLIAEFRLLPFPEAYRKRLESELVETVYRSTRNARLRVIDKVNGGSKADAINAAVNACRCPLVCVVDADSVLQTDSLRRAVRPFLEDATTVAVGGTVRIANGCTLRGGFLEKVGLPKRFLPLVQVVEYLRAFLFGRMGWSPINGLLIISGAFGVFHKETLVEVGGFNRAAVGEDMELVLRLHRTLKQQRRPYRIAFIPDPVCWTDAPTNLGDLRGQRVRWQHGLGQALFMNRWLFFNPRGGTVSWFSVPFYLLFELFGPLIEVAGYLFILTCGVMGWLSWPQTALFLALAVGLGMLLSTSSILLEELSFHTYPRFRDLLLLYLIAVAENFGYRQLTALWRVQGLAAWLRGGRHEWKTISRSTGMTDRE